jgi:hypothetical protein
MTNFTTPDALFSWVLPPDWSEYDDDEGTYCFFNTISWTGNFRITPLKLNPKNSVASTISEQISNNANAIEVKIGDYDCAFYKRDITQDEDSLVIYFWITGMENYLFTCSFVIDKDQESTNKNELELVEDIIKSIKLH